MKDSLVTVRTFDHPIEAHIAAGKLESEGIPFFLKNIHHASLSWPITNALGGIQLQVPQESFLAATELLDEGASSAEQADEERCPKCGSSETSRSKWRWRLALFSFHIAGLPIPWGRSSWVCNNCSEIWSPGDAD